MAENSILDFDEKALATSLGRAETDTGNAVAKLGKPVYQWKGGGGKG
ncbi:MULTISPECIES: hypothetical protein [unclassified Clostridium]|nr:MULTISPECIES: hypothetical protein [unclassified Clostridium]